MRERKDGQFRVRAYRFIEEFLRPVIHRWMQCPGHSLGKEASPGASGGRDVRRQRQVRDHQTSPPIRPGKNPGGAGLLATIHSHLTGYGQRSLGEIRTSRTQDAAGLQ